MEGLKHESCHYLNSTNNRLQSINQKIESVVSRYSSILNYFQDLTKCLDSLALERDHRADKVLKCSVRLFTVLESLHYLMSQRMTGVHYVITMSVIL